MNFKIFSLLVLAIVLIVCKKSSAAPQNMPGMPPMPSMPSMPSMPGMPDPSSMMPKEMADKMEAVKGFKDMAAGAMPASPF